MDGASVRHQRPIRQRSQAPFIAGYGLEYNIWDGQNRLRTINVNDTTHSHFTDFPGYWGGLTSIQDELEDNLTAHYCFDLNGNTLATTAPDGTANGNYWYTAFGVQNYQTGWPYNFQQFSAQYGGFVPTQEFLTYLQASACNPLNLPPGNPYPCAQFGTNCYALLCDPEFIAECLIYCNSGKMGPGAWISYCYDCVCADPPYTDIVIGRVCLCARL